jgi:hypothetical protein
LQGRISLGPDFFNERSWLGPTFSVSSYFFFHLLFFVKTNLGNTCFLNAVLQCMFHTIPLMRSVLNSQLPSDAQRKYTFACACMVQTTPSLLPITLNHTRAPTRTVNGRMDARGVPKTRKHV